MQLTLNMIKEENAPAKIVDYFRFNFGNRTEVNEVFDSEHDINFIKFLIKKFPLYQTQKTFEYVLTLQPDYLYLFDLMLNVKAFQTQKNFDSIKEFGFDYITMLIFVSQIKTLQTLENYEYVKTLKNTDK